MNNYQDMNAMKTKLILTAALLIAVFSGCKKEKYLTASFGVRNTTETVYTTAARLEATFSYPGTKYVIRVDVSERQDMSEAAHYDVKVNGDKLTADVTGLKANTTYYYRYSNDTGFGILSSEQKSFKTNDYSVPAVTTAEVSEITGSSAKCGGNVTSDGGFAVTARGVCWSTSPNPTVSDSHTTDGSGTGSFTSSITGLTANTKYYVRAYATNSAGTSYGEQRIFTTLQNITSPTVTTNNVTDITQTIATCGGNVTSDGGAAVTARGVCWSTSHNPTVSDSHTTDGSGTGSFTSIITGLTANTTYYVRAYATNSAGTSYGEQKSFTTLSGGGSSGCFSVSPTTTVEFAPGNLYWDGSAFRFEANQWSTTPAPNGTWDASHVSHFKWSDAANAVTGNYSYSGGLFCANNFTVAGDSHTWRTLSKAEWDYLLNTRDNASSLRAWKKLDGGTHEGLVILPDGTDASVMDSITSTDALASHGAVFLPAAGGRYGTGVYGVGSYGYYWSSTPFEGDEGYACRMYFYSGGNVGTDYDGRDYGYAVRLVR